MQAAQIACGNRCSNNVQFYKVIVLEYKPYKDGSAKSALKACCDGKNKWATGTTHVAFGVQVGNHERTRTHTHTHTKTRRVQTVKLLNMKFSLHSCYFCLRFSILLSTLFSNITQSMYFHINDHVKIIVLRNIYSHNLDVVNRQFLPHPIRHYII
jgi:hypothetical protein